LDSILTPSYSQIYFSKRYDLLQNETPVYSHDIIQQESTYIVFTEAVPDAGYRYFGFILLDSLGNLISNDIAYSDNSKGLTTGYSGSFIKTSDNAGFSMVGFAYNYVTGGRWDRGMLWRFDNNLDTLWTRTYSDVPPKDTSFLFRNFRELPDKGYIIVGSHGLVNGSAPIRINLHRVDSLGCEAPDQCWVGEDEIWVKTFTPEKPFIVYPNPATDKLSVEFHINQEGAEIELLNLIGQSMLRSRIPPKRDILELNVGHLSKGLYILKVTISGKKPMMEKVVVQ